VRFALKLGLSANQLHATAARVIRGHHCRAVVLLLLELLLLQGARAPLGATLGGGGDR
jgi:hypothetical protein